MATSSYTEVARRALPRVGIATLGILLARVTHGIVSWVFLITTIGAIVSLMMNPHLWALMRTGADIAPLLNSTTSGVGRVVTLENPGRQGIEVVKVLRELTGMSFADAKLALDRTPLVIGSSPTPSAAQRAVEMLEAVGAAATISDEGTKGTR